MPLFKELPARFSYQFLSWALTASLLVYPALQASSPSENSSVPQKPSKDFITTHTPHLPSPASIDSLTEVPTMAEQIKLIEKITVHCEDPNTPYECVRNKEELDQQIIKGTKILYIDETLPEEQKVALFSYIDQLHTEGFTVTLAPQLEPSGRIGTPDFPYAETRPTFWTVDTGFWYKYPSEENGDKLKVTKTVADVIRKDGILSIHGVNVFTTDQFGTATFANSFFVFTENTDPENLQPALRDNKPHGAFILNRTITQFPYPANYIVIDMNSALEGLPKILRLLQGKLPHGVLNRSIGIENDGSLDELIATAQENGIQVITSAGNDGITANRVISEAVIAGATEKVSGNNIQEETYQLTQYSNYYSQKTDQEKSIVAQLNTNGLWFNQPDSVAEDGSFLCNFRYGTSLSAPELSLVWLRVIQDYLNSQHRIPNNQEILQTILAETKTFTDTHVLTDTTTITAAGSFEDFQSVITEYLLPMSDIDITQIESISVSFNLYLGVKALIPFGINARTLLPGHYPYSDTTKRIKDLKEILIPGYQDSSEITFTFTLFDGQHISKSSDYKNMTLLLDGLPANTATQLSGVATVAAENFLYVPPASNDSLTNFECGGTAGAATTIFLPIIQRYAE